ncbi:MAG: cell division protein ZapA [Salinivenus sp.]
MAESDNMKSIRVHILGREYALRVREENEAFTREVAAFVNARMEKFKDAHPEQAELTTAVITALALAEDLHDLRDDIDAEHDTVRDEINSLSDRLEASLEPSPAAEEREA